jgi:hypothetical protein
MLLNQISLPSYYLSFYQSNHSDKLQKATFYNNQTMKLSKNISIYFLFESAYQILSYPLTYFEIKEHSLKMEDVESDHLKRVVCLPLKKPKCQMLADL